MIPQKLGPPTKAVLRTSDGVAYIVVMLAVGLVVDAAMRRFQSRFLRWAEE